MVLAVLVAVGAVALDLVARTATQDALASRVKARTGASAVSVRIKSFPFIWDVAVEGKVTETDIVAKDVPVGPVHLSRVEVDTHDISLDRAELFDAHHVRLTSIGSARVTVLIHLSDLVTSAAAALDLQPSIEAGDRLVVRAGGLVVASVRLSTSPVIPDCSFSVSPVSGGDVLSCSVAPVPAGLVQTLSRV